MSLTALIIEDEAPARQVIRDYLNAFPDIHLLGECDNGRDAVDMIHDLKPDFIFLDIQLPEFNGIQVLEQLKFMPRVIFSTAYDEYAIQAFEINAVDYLLKPYNHQRFARCIERVRETAADTTSQSIQNLLQTLQRSEYLQRLLVPDQDNMIFIRVQDIDYIEAADNYVSIVTGKDTFLLLQRLSELENKLDPMQFFRIHRSFMVNMDKVKSLQPPAYVVLYNGKKLPLSRRRLQSFKDRFA